MMNNLDNELVFATKEAEEKTTKKIKEKLTLMR